MFSPHLTFCIGSRLGRLAGWPGVRRHHPRTAPLIADPHPSTVAGSITDWDSKTVIGSKARAPTVTKDGAALNAARRSGAAIETDKKTAGNKIPGVDHAKIAKLDRENEVAPPPTVSLELGKVLQQARQNFKDADGNPKPMSQGDLAKAINQKQTVIQEYENMRAKPDPALLGKMERILKVKLRGSGIGQPLGGPKKK